MSPAQVNPLPVNPERHVHLMTKPAVDAINTKGQRLGLHTSLVLNQAGAYPGNNTSLYGNTNTSALLVCKTTRGKSLHNK